MVPQSNISKTALILIFLATAKKSLLKVLADFLKSPAVALED